MKKYKRLAIAATMTVGLLLSACGNDKNATDSEKSSSDKQLTIAHFYEMKELDPVIAWDGWNLSRMGIGENLIQLDENMNIKPVIAQEWEEQDTRTTIFTIRDDVTFHNGKAVDAEAVKASLERAIATTDREDIKIPVATIEAQGNKLTITTTEPFPTLLNNLADPVYIIVDATAAEQDEAKFKLHPIATGPFKIERFAPPMEMNLVKHTEHWSGAVAVDKVTVKGIADDATRVMALQSGEVDFITQVGAKDVQLFEGNEAYNVLRGPNLRVFQLGINMRQPYMNNLAFRQAMAHALNKEMYAENLVKGTPAVGPFTKELSFGYQGEDKYQYDVDKANALLDKAGFKDSDGNGIRELDGEDIILKYVLTTDHGNDAKNVAVAIQDDFKKVGIGVDVVLVENYNDMVNNGDYDLVWERWTSAPTADPAYFIEANYVTDALGNKGKYTNAEIDKIVEAFHNEFDKEKRDTLGREATEILLEDIPTLFMYYQEGTVITKANVTGIARFMSEIYYIDERVKVD